MNEMDEAGWWLCYSDDGERRTFHYFARKYLRSVCGVGASYQRSIREPVFFAQRSIVAQMKASDLRAVFCRLCAKREGP